MDLRESMHRILLQANTLADLFYLVFLSRYPEVQAFFSGVDMKRQNVLLTMALLAVERHAEHKYPATQSYLKLLGEQHKARGITPELYPRWRSAMLETLERFHGADWQEPLSLQWSAAIDAAIEAMLATDERR